MLKREIRWLLSEKYNSKLTSQAWEDIHKLKKGEHIDYLIGSVNFLGCRLDLSKRPLIPRTETEYWVEQAIKGSVPKGDEPQWTYRTSHFLDIFSGSGCIGLAILKHIPNAIVTFSDSEDNCIKQIKINCEINKIDPKRYKIVKSNVFNSLPKHIKFNYIFANPPYIPTHSTDIQKSVLINEPPEALFGGKDGLKYIRKFLMEAKHFLRKGGKIYMEFDHPQKAQVEDLLKGYGYMEYSFQKDQFNKWRYIELNWGPSLKGTDP